MRNLFLCLLLLPLLAQRLPAQADLKALDTYIENARKEWAVPGLSVAVVKDGKVVLAKGYGVKELGKTDPVDDNTLFAIASNTKAFISASIALLVEEGKLKWDDPVKKYLPYFELYNPFVSAHTTVRDLLCHRVGLGTFSGDVLWFKSNYTAEEVVRHAKYLPAAYEFRAGYGYTNLMFIAAGEVIRAVSGQSWDAFVKARLFQPLGMNRSQTSVNDLVKTGNFATPHKSVYGPAEPIAYARWDNMGAAGGILSSATDMAKWLQLQLAHGAWGGKQVFKQESQDVFWTMHNSFRVGWNARSAAPARNFSGYALGWNVTDNGGRLVVSHGGGYDGMYSQVMLWPQANLGVVVLTNSMTGISGNLCNYIADRFLGNPEKDWCKQGLDGEKRHQATRKDWVDQRVKARVQGTTPSLPLKDLAGTYFDPLYGEVVIRESGNALELHFPHAPSLDAKLTHWHFNTFQIQWNEPHAWFDFGTIQFVADNKNQRVSELRFDVPNEDIFFEEIHAVRR